MASLHGFCAWSEARAQRYHFIEQEACADVVEGTVNGHVDVGAWP